MTTITTQTIRDNRATAGARYAAAVEELAEAYIDLLARDLALANANIADTVPADRSRRTFPRDGFEALLRELRHGEFAPIVEGDGTTAGGDWDALVKARIAEIRASIGQPIPE